MRNSEITAYSEMPADEKFNTVCAMASLVFAGAMYVGLGVHLTSSGVYYGPDEERTDALVSSIAADATDINELTGQRFPMLNANQGDTVDIHVLDVFAKASNNQVTCIEYSAFQDIPSRFPQQDGVGMLPKLPSAGMSGARTHCLG
jgi:hypothetical protein